jgi:predicted SAM-dependent methyltransferase
MKYLNLGCGNRFHKDWINIDFELSSPWVQQHDIRKDLPYADNVFDVCYCSHVLEHLKRTEADKVVKEIYRILKPGAIVRLVVPDLEKITRAYLLALERVMAGDKYRESDYDWMMLELYDQTVRTFPGGEMAQYLRNPNISNKEFVLSRIGEEAENILNEAVRLTEKSFFKKVKDQKFSQLIRIMNNNIRNSVSKILVRIISGKEALLAFEEGLFRKSGEIHRWMYDRFSLSRLLVLSGFVDVRICAADQSQIPNFNNYQLDTIDGKVRKTDSLFMEGRKP